MDNLDSQNKITIRIFPVKDLSMIIIDSNVAKKIVNIIDENNLKNICVIVPTLDSFDDFSHFKSSLDDKIERINIVHVDSFKSEDYEKVRITVDMLISLFKEGGCLFLSNDKKYIGLALSYFFVTINKDHRDAIERVKNIHPTLLPKKDELEGLKKYCDYLNKPEIQKKRIPIEEGISSEDLNVESEENKILFFGLVEFLTKIFSRYSIKNKLILMITFLISVSLAIMILLASYFFKEDSSIRIKENNLNDARAFGLMIQSNFDALVEKTRIIASTMKDKDNRKYGAIKENFSLNNKNNKNILFVGIAQKSGNRIQLVKKLYNNFKIDENNLQVSKFHKSLKTKKNQIIKSFNGDYVFLNISQGLKIPVIALYFPLNETPYNSEIVICYLKMNHILKIFQISGVLKSQMVNEIGDVLAHSNSNLVVSSVNISNSPIVKEMLSSKLNNGQKRYKDRNGEHYLGSFKKLNKYGLGIIVSAKESQIFEAVYQIQKRNIIILLIVLLIAIFLAFFFAKTLSIPIIKLVDETYKFQEKNLSKKEMGKKDEVEFLTTSFHAMVDAILDSKRKLQDYAENLEFMVDERTAELKEARDELWGEMKLANKIQTVLLPEDPKIEGFDIKGFMMPADEVGGDYFDVINVEGRDWFVIGDVSGHGVSAGLVMMMVQTSVRVALYQNPNISPSDLLAVVNKVIAYNIKRLGEKKYMTITICACLENGMLHHAGLHIDLLLYRNSTKQVERIQTSGMWIGLVDEISDYVNDSSMKMDPQDVLLMYTDGVTEAPDKNGDLFSTDKLAGILENLGRSSLEEIQNGILSELEEYEKDDDVTMLILRKV